MSVILSPKSIPLANKRQTRSAADKAVLQLRVDGPGIRRGRVPIPELITICQEMQNAISRQAEALEGRKTVHPGPVALIIRQECTLELIGIKGGSATLQFDVAKPQVTLEEVGTLANEAVDELAKTIKLLGNGNHKTAEIAPGVLRSLYNLGSVLETKRITSLQWIVPRRIGHKRVSADITKPLMKKIASKLSAPRKAMITVDGVLDMSDFKPSDRKCRIAPPLGVPLDWTFEAEKDDVILKLMRRPVRVSGEAEIQPDTDRPGVLHIQTIQELPSLELGKGLFWSNMSIAELAAAQDVKPLKNVSQLASGIQDEEDLDGILEEIYSSRK